MRTLTGLLISISVGVSAPALAQQDDVSDDLAAELLRAAPSNTEIQSDKDREPVAKRKKKTVRKKVLETETEFETEAMRLPSADDLFSGKADVSDDAPRAPRAVQTNGRMVERIIEVEEEVDPGPTAVAGEQEFRTQGWLPRTQAQGPGESHAGSARVVPPAAHFEASEDMGSRAIDRPVRAGERLAADPVIGEPISAQALEGLVETEVRNIAGRRVEHVGALRAELDENLRRLALLTEPDSTDGRDDALSALEETLGRMETEVENIALTMGRLGPGENSSSVSHLQERVERASVRLETLRAATSASATEFGHALRAFREVVGDIERERTMLERRRF